MSLTIPVTDIQEGLAATFRSGINTNFSVTAIANEPWDGVKTQPASVPNAIGQLCLMYSSTVNKLFQCVSYTSSSSYKWLEITKDMINLSSISNPQLSSPTLTGTVTIPSGSSLIANGTSTLASPSLTGIPTAPTASVGTNTTQIATTAFVNSSIQSAVSYGVSSTIAGAAVKAVTLANFSLFIGKFLAVTFSNGNTANNISISVNGTEAKAVYYSGSPVLAYMITHSTNVFIMMYDGTYWQLANPERTTVIAGNSAPQNTSAFWIDTTSSSGGLKYYTGSAWTWVPVAYST